MPRSLRPAARSELNCARLRERFLKIRSISEAIAAPLTAEDCAIQSMADVSPTRWHLAHTTWFFETFVLKTLADYVPFDPEYEFLFNSYYNSVGKQFPRDQRGLISRPGLLEILAYRQYVDRNITSWLQSPDEELVPLAATFEVGLQHEQQHQELMLTDIKHVLSCNPLHPSYHTKSYLTAPSHRATMPESDWLHVDEEIVEIGHAGQGFAYDNEGPNHRQLVPAHSIATHLVTNREYLDFVCDGGYQRPEHWLSLGWQHVQSDRWQHPLYWVENGDGWAQFTLAGLRDLEPNDPVCHISYFEADAYARWANARLPTEFEWEASASREQLTTSDSLNQGVFVDRLLAAGNMIAPQPASHWGDWMGNLWEWTSSSYGPYPGYRPPAGAIGEYNGKFMCNQYVLRGGSCATSSDHIRLSYRNFFPPAARWQFAGIRLAR